MGVFFKTFSTSLLFISKLIPTPKTRFSILFDSNDASTNIPASFFPLIVRSFGHFNSVDILHVFSIAVESANDDAIGNNVILEISNFGCKIMEKNIPPFGEIHFLPDLPFPPVCFSAMMIIPSSSDSFAIFNASFCVDSTDS